jgi:hypothetical protein
MSKKFLKILEAHHTVLILWGNPYINDYKCDITITFLNKKRGVESKLEGILKLLSFAYEKAKPKNRVPDWLKNFQAQHIPYYLQISHPS